MDNTLNTAKELTYAVVMKLVEGLENNGHHLYCDSFYSSPALFIDLRELGFGACGTVRLNRKGLPKRIKSECKMSKGEVKSVKRNGLLFLKWMDKRAATMITTIHDESVVPVQRRSRFGAGGLEDIQKPKCIVEHNQHMGGVDLSDQQISYYYSFGHRTVKWW